MPFWHPSGTRVIYLTCRFFVCEPGHSHPRLASVAAKQLSKVNTNTRYLCPKRVAYAQRLLNTFPEELDTVFFVNSGSEANDLALRLARAFTGNVDVLVLGAAYHGHTSSLIEVSPYKYEGKGGFAQRPHVHKVAAPDTYRGPHKGFHAGSLYAEEVRCVEPLETYSESSGSSCRSIPCLERKPKPHVAGPHAWPAMRSLPELGIGAVQGCM